MKWKINKEKIEKARKFFKTLEGLTPDQQEKLMDAIAKETLYSYRRNPYENRKIKGIYKSRYVASWINEGGSMLYIDAFRGWLETLEINGEKLSPEEIDEIDQYGHSGKSELEWAAKEYLSLESH